MDVRRVVSHWQEFRMAQTKKVGLVFPFRAPDPYLNILKIKIKIKITHGRRLRLHSRTHAYLP